MRLEALLRAHSYMKVERPPALERRLVTAGVQFAYIRKLPEEGSFTVFFRCGPRASKTGR